MVDSLVFLLEGIISFGERKCLAGRRDTPVVIKSQGERRP